MSTEAAGTIEYTLKVDAKSGTLSLKNAAGEFVKLGGKAQGAGDKASKGFKAMLKDMRGIYRDLSQINQGFELAKKVWSAVSGPIDSFISTASDARETANLFFAVFKDQAPAAMAFVEKLSTDINRAKTEISGAMGAFQDTFVPMQFARADAMKLSETLTVLGYDLSSFKNKNVHEVWNDLQSAIVGNHETMLKYGVVINQSELNQELLNMKVEGGIKNATTQEKVMARVNMIIRGTADAQGDAAKTANDWANMMRGISSIFTGFQEIIGSEMIDDLTPQFQEIKNYISENRDEIESWMKAVGRTIGTTLSLLIDFGKVLFALREPLTIIGTTLAAMWVATKLKAYTALWTLLTTKVTLATTATGAHTLVVKGATKAWGFFKAALPFAAVALMTMKLVQMNKLLNDWADSYDKIEAAERRHLATQNFSTDRFRAFRDEVGLTGDALRDITKDFADIEDRGIRYNKILQAIARGKYGDELKEQFEKWNKSQRAAKEGAGEVEKKIKDLTKEFENLAAKLDILTNKGYKELLTEGQLLGKMLQDEEEQIFSSGEKTKVFHDFLKSLIDEIEAGNRDVPAWMRNMMGQVRAEYIETLPKMKETKDVLDKTRSLTLPGLNLMMSDTAISTRSVGDIFGFSQEKISGFDLEIEWLLEDLAEFVGVLYSATSALQTLGIISDQTAGKINNITKGIDSVGKGIQGFKGAKKAFEDTGFSLETLSKGFSSFSAIASGAITVVKTLIDLFTGDGIQEAIDRENGWMGLTSALNEQLHKLAEEMGNTHAATSVMLSQIMNESLDPSNWEQFADRVRAIQQNVIEGTLTQAEANKAMGESFTVLAAKAAEWGKEGTYYMLQIIRQARDMKLEISEIDAYVDEKLGGGVQALNTYLNTMTGSLGDNIQFVEANLLRLFGAYQEQGYSFLEIVGLMGDSLTTLAEKAGAENLAVSGAIQEMIDLQGFLKQNETLIQNIEATGDMMRSLGDSAFLTQDIFTSFGQEALKQFDALIAAGASERDALRLLGPQLSDMIKYAESYGFAIDAQTQALITKAETEGVLNAASLSDSEKQTMLMERIVELLGGDIPYAVKGLTDQVTTSMEGIRGQTQHWQSGLDSIQDTIQNSLPAAVAQLDDQYREHMTGHSIVTETYKWKKALLDVDTTIYSLGTETVSFLDESFVVLTGKLTGSALEIKDEFFSMYSSMIENQENLTASLDYLERQKLKTDVPEALEALETKFKSVQNALSADTKMYQKYLDDIITKYEIELPGGLDTLEKKYAWLMSSMKASSEDFYIGADGVIRDLTELYRLKGFAIEMVDKQLYNLSRDTVSFLDQEWVVLTGKLTGNALSIKEEFAGAYASMIANQERLTTELDYLDQQKLSTDIPAALEELERKYSITADTLAADTMMYQGYIDEIIEKYNIELPAGLDTVQQKYQWLMSAMSASSQELYLSTEGVIYNLNEIIRLNATSMAGASGFGSKYGIYTDEEKTEKTTEFLAMMKLWGSDREKILSDPTAMANFYRDIQGFQGAITDEFQDRYENWFASIGQWNKHIQKGDIFNEDTKTWTIAEQETSNTKPTTYNTPRPSRSTYTTRPSSSTPPTATTSAQGGEKKVYIEVTLNTQAPTRDDLAKDIAHILKYDTQFVRTAIEDIAEKEIEKCGTG